MFNDIPVLSGLYLLLAGCAQPTPETSSDSEPDAPSAAQLTVSSIIVGAHTDVPIHLFLPADVSEATEPGQIDYPRSVAGGPNAASILRHHSRALAVCQSERHS